MMSNATRLAIEFGRLVRFGLTGTFAALAYAGTTFVLVEVILARPITATIAGYCAAATISYLGHLYFSFRVEPNHRRFLWRFAVTVVITFLMTILITYVITVIFGGSYRFSIAAVTMLIPITNYFCNRFWVFLPDLNARGNKMRSRSGIARRPIDEPMTLQPFPFHTAFITGAAGFIGSNLVDRLLAQGMRVVGYDNMSTGCPEFLADARRHPAFTLHQADVLDSKRLTASMEGCDVVFHLSANADVRFGLDHPRRDLEQNTIGTFNVLEAMRANGVMGITFASTGSVYGEAKVIPTPEDAPFPIQTSLYAASKLAGEGLIASYCEGYDMRSWIFRFVSILGERYTHGHVFDFYKALLADPSRLHVLGNGHQRKSYLYVQDCIDAILLAMSEATDKVNILNLGTEEHCEVNDSIGWITGYLGATPKLDYAGGERGWVGDNPLIFLDTTRMRSLGWRPKLTIREGVARTLSWLAENRWVLERRI